MQKVPLFVDGADEQQPCEHDECACLVGAEGAQSGRNTAVEGYESKYEWRLQKRSGEVEQKRPQPDFFEPQSGAKSQRLPITEGRKHGHYTQ